MIKEQIKKILCKAQIVLLAFLTVFTFSCKYSASDTTSTTDETEDESSSDSSESDSDTSDSNSSTENQAADNISTTSIKMYKISGTSITIDTTGDGGKTVYMAKVNATSSPVSTQYCVSSATGLTLNQKSGGFGRAIGDDTDDTYEITSDNISSTDSRDFCGVIDITDKIAFNLTDFSCSARTASTTSAEENYEIDDTRSFYISDSNSRYSSKSATLYAKTDDVYVWVIDDYANPYISSTEQKEFTKEMAQTYADKMQSMYKYITNVYSDIPSQLLYSSNGKFASESIVDMTTFSKTGTKINIIITDCDDDNSASSVSGGVVGFTSSVDLLASDSGKVTLSNASYYSNTGNIFYLDNYWAVANTNDSISTLAHEFQHLLAFGCKWVNKNLSLFESTQTVAYGEMMSMLCEDMMQNYLGLDNIYSPIARLPYYNSNYYLLGVLDYSESSTKLLSTSYSGAYAFGAWLVREYGGTKLIHQMANNDYVGMDSILEAIKTVTGKSYTQDELMKLYIQCLINKTAAENTPTLNKTPETGLTYNGYEYPLKAIDLWNLDNLLSTDFYKNSSISYSFDGPEYLASNIYSSIPSYGFTLHEIGTVNSGSDEITLKLSSTKNTNGHRHEISSSKSTSNLDYYVLIQE